MNESTVKIFLTRNKTFSNWKIEENILFIYGHEENNKILISEIKCLRAFKNYISIVTDSYEIRCLKRNEETYKEKLKDLLISIKKELEEK